jgi:hypothetical protein
MLLISSTNVDYLRSGEEKQLEIERKKNKPEFRVVSFQKKVNGPMGI